MHSSEQFNGSKKWCDFCNGYVAGKTLIGIMTLIDVVYQYACCLSFLCYVNMDVKTGLYIDLYVKGGLSYA